MEPRAEALLQEGLAAFGLDSQENLASRLGNYLDLLCKWNRAYNLSAVRDPVEMVTRHLLDSLVVLPWLRGDRLLDVGTGPGLPGIPLALARPDLRVSLLDSNGKKTRFLTQAKLELALTNVSVVDSRVEAYRPGRVFDTVISRAFSDVAAFVDLAEPLVAPGGQLLAMKGRLDPQEVEQVRRDGVKLDIHALTVPRLDAERHLLQIHFI